MCMEVEVGGMQEKGLTGREEMGREEMVVQRKGEKRG